MDNILSEQISDPHASSDTRRKELADFLRTRRDKLKPETNGASQNMQSSRRRTPGLRREEVAELAGVGTTWYTWLEQARDIQPSCDVLRRLAQALRLTLAETRHMYTLAGKAAPVHPGEVTNTVSTSLHRFFHEALQIPAVLLGSCWEILDLNDQAKVLFRDLEELPAERRNWMLYAFGSEGMRTQVLDWKESARRLIAEFRLSLGDCFDHPCTVELLTKLKAESPEFDRWWKEHNVRESEPEKFEIQSSGNGKFLTERLTLQPSENPRLKILIFTPLREGSEPF